MTGFCTRIAPAFRTGRLIVPLTAGICLVLLAVVLKNILQVPAAQLSSDMILYIIVYTGFIVAYSAGEPAAASSLKTKLWAGAIVAATIGIIAVCAI